MSALIEVSGLVKRYGDFAAVDDISFDVEEGAFFGFLGPNGAGKTTTMRILATLLKSSSGSVKVGGYNVAENPNAVRRLIGFAMQDISLDFMASAYENLQLLGVLYGMSPRNSRKRAEELIEMVGLTKVATKWVNTYSGGMKRRLDLAGTLMHNPKLLFLDEPTQGLDPQARRLIWDYLRDLNRQGSTMFLTTHYMDEADILCGDLAFIDHGKIIRRGAPAQLKAQLGGDVITLKFADGTPMEAIKSMLTSIIGADAAITITDSAAIFAAAKAGELAPSLINLLSEKGNAPISLNIAQPSLEDLFVQLVGRSILDDDNQLVKGRDPFVEGRR